MLRSVSSDGLGLGLGVASERYNGPMSSNPESLSSAVVLLVFMVLVTILGASLMLALLIVWRRSLARRPSDREKTEHIDTWTAAGERVKVRPARPTSERDSDSAASPHGPPPDEQDDLPYQDPPPPSFLDHEDEDQEQEDESYFSEEDRPYDPSAEEPDEDDSDDADDPQNPFGRR